VLSEDELPLEEALGCSLCVLPELLSGSLFRALSFIVEASSPADGFSVPSSASAAGNANARIAFAPAIPIATVASPAVTPTHVLIAARLEGSYGTWQAFAKLFQCIAKCTTVNAHSAYAENEWIMLQVIYENQSSNDSPIPERMWLKAIELTTSGTNANKSKIAKIACAIPRLLARPALIERDMLRAHLAESAKCTAMVTKKAKPTIS